MFANLQAADWVCFDLQALWQIIRSEGLGSDEPTK